MKFPGTSKKTAEQYSYKDFQIGDRVFLKSMRGRADRDHHAMVVEKVSGSSVQCVWMNNCEVFRNEFSPQTLES